MIAESIETPTQASAMRARCGEGQGYLFGRPMPADAFTARLMAESAPVGRVRATA